jgi:Na+-transporting NADH:ubiquinone oxidoreductase subunit NqrF
MDYQKVFPDFTYIPVLSQCKPEDKYCGRTGYIMPYLKEVIRNPLNTEAYMCGSPGMLEAAKKELVILGVPADKIYFDSFG